MSINGVGYNDNQVREREEENQNRREITIDTPESSEPSESIFNLNDYYNQGYKKDEQNEEEAVVMQQDILDLYDISSSDPDKTEKLVRIYQDILSDSNNSIFAGYCRSNGISTEYDGENADDYIDGISLAMAHMSHDGSSKGDLIRLTDVDFSGIDSGNTVNGSIETIKTENGNDYVVYGPDNSVLKVVSYETAENGLTTISVYSDAEKTKVISSDTAYRLEKNDNNTKFKFGSGNQNTVDIKDNGDSLSVNITKGVLSADYTVQKNSDGTYSLNGKQYFTLDEIAVELNGVEITPSDTLDGEISGSGQGKVGNCGVLTALNSLSVTDFGSEAIKNAVSIDENGNATVTFKAVNKSYTVSAKEMANGKRFSSGDLDVRAIEIAYEKMMKDVQNGNLVTNDYPPYYIFTTEDTGYYANHGVELSTGTYPSAVYYMLTGIKCTKWAFQDDSTRLNTLDTMENNGSASMSVANLGVRSEGNSQRTTQYNDHVVQDAFGKDVKIYDAHHYAVKESDTQPNGERLVTIINPWDSTSEIVLNQATFLSLFNSTFNVDYTDEAGKYVYYIEA